MTRSLFAAAVFAFAGSASALTPSEVFEKVSPSVWMVVGLDSQERPSTFGSGVVIEAGKLVTNCHVLSRARAVQVKRENIIYVAKLEHADVERDLCILTIANFSAPAVKVVPMSAVKVGQRAYAVGNPERLALTLSEGLISGLRSDIVQTSAPISPGSSGGGLFDDQGRLVGITTLIYLGSTRIAQNLNFAVPAEWIAEVPERAKEQLAKRRSGATKQATGGGASALQAAAAGLPAPGTSWKYSFRDARYSAPARTFTVQIESVSGYMVRESFTAGDRDPISVSVNAKEIRFESRPLSSDYSVKELAPYLYSSSEKDFAAASPDRYAPGQWAIEPATFADEEISVPAGTYKTVRVQVSGKNRKQQFGSSTAAMLETLRFRYTAWYAPAVNRYVKFEHETWNRVGSPLSDEVAQLLEYHH